MTDAVVLLRYTRYFLVRNTIVMFVLLTFGIWILEVSGHGLVLHSHSAVHRRHPGSADEQPLEGSATQETREVGELHERRFAGNDSEAITLANIFEWDEPE